MKQFSWGPTVGCHIAAVTQHSLETVVWLVLRRGVQRENLYHVYNLGFPLALVLVFALQLRTVLLRMLV